MFRHNRTDEYIADFCDGKLYKTHELFQNEANALQLIAYFDEVEVCNPLAGHAGVHKLGKSFSVCKSLAGQKI